MGRGPELDPYGVIVVFDFLSLKCAAACCSRQAVTARDSMAKSLYSALFDWIVLRINHALLNKKDMEESVRVRHGATHAPCTQNMHKTCVMRGVSLEGLAPPTVHLLTSASWEPEAPSFGVKLNRYLMSVSRVP